MIYDRFGRPLTSMRISITQRCNLDCIYCHREGIFQDSGMEMTPEEISRISRICAQQGVTKVKITGGEPLLRNDVCEIVRNISKIEGIKDLSMTTNGVLLKKRAGDLKESGLDRLNVSLDTLKPEVFKRITGGGDLRKVTEGIERAIEVGLRPVKLNMVVMKGINDGEIGELIEYYSREGVVLQLIELMDTDGEFFERYFYDLDEVERELEGKASRIRVRKYMQGRRKYILDGAQVEVIKPMHNSEFCAHCTRIRVTADGRFKPCLMRTDNLVDFLTPMREGASDEELNRLFAEAVGRREPFFKDSS
jgi:cyclic pyranopterin phosphate synthase